MPESVNPETQHERSDVNVRALLLFAAIFIVFAVVTHLVLQVSRHDAVVEGEDGEQADIPGDRPRARHPISERRIVIFAPSHVTNELEHMALTIGKIRDEPLAKEVAQFERQAKEHVPRPGYAGRSSGAGILAAGTRQPAGRKARRCEEVGLYRVRRRELAGQ